MDPMLHDLQGARTSKTFYRTSRQLETDPLRDFDLTRIEADENVRARFKPPWNEAGGLTAFTRTGIAFLQNPAAVLSKGSKKRSPI